MSAKSNLHELESTNDLRMIKNIVGSDNASSDQEIE